MRREDGGIVSRVLRWLLWVLKGIIIGGGAILPGISGGVLTVSFRIYRPMMETLSHPRTNLPRYWKMFLPVLIGWLLGFLVFAKGIDAFFRADSNIAVCLFGGLVAGSLPQIFLEADRSGSRRGDWVGFVVTLFLAMTAVLLLNGKWEEHDVTPGFLWFLFCGALWGLSLVVPGLTSSSILIWLGLFQPLTAGISALRPEVLLPFGAGIAVTVLFTARLVNWFFQRHGGLATRMILAIVIASTLAILPDRFNGWGEGMLCAAVFAAGFAAAWAMDRYGKRQDPEAAAETKDTEIT